MSSDVSVLLITAASIGFFHTLFGPDHYLPFISMAWARKWSLKKTTFITFLCGLGHIGSSVVLGMIGVALGIAVNKLEVIESTRGNLAAWLLIAFGLVYFVWGMRRAYKARPHTHEHAHEDGSMHAHHHSHFKSHSHIHKKKANITPWILFVIFVFGPCEPLIPILMYPAAQNSIAGLLLVTAVFGAVTILTMMSIVILSTLGVSFVPLAKLERFTHALAGATICLCGLAIQLLGL
jgi:sulfite exporter TauE/SafE